MKEYRDCFEGLGCLPGQHTIHVDESVSPVVHPCRKVPFKLRERLKEELARMEKMKVIQKIDEPTEWVSSLVIVQKKTGALRICLDPRALNKAIKREDFKLPTREEIMAQFAGAKWFSKLDASSGFWQLKLEEESSKLCTFNTPEGRYRFLRLPYGILSAPEKYDVQMTYTPGKYMFTADTLSRAVDKKESADSEKSAEIKAYVHMIVTSLPVTADRTEQIRK
ncbi:hypothetical protein N1851_024069 [Merluccius polli]|uniref:Reverse transcriptase domain-containing protein n=1 Tax=Merluccius polli TaxID=89951 RepID=A0AA47MFQ7_MERPO|nr:hypothetical protein N1851_024069 [Merluccius polli]